MLDTHPVALRGNALIGNGQHSYHTVDRRLHQFAQANVGDSSRRLDDKYRFTTKRQGADNVET
ncbi:hypothetical protein BES08_12545 [Novosphingobium resinovorum]|uniref:Uncharacterized protein n=1 Tax=Novosphingobium resinovorum TaxID=158500 RepID=A0A1D8A5W4_9SPHN|nr:hypothetical protein BES08_12545 [Novosphingobium resinovorum]